MRGLLLILAFASFVPLSVLAPFTGVLTWTWLSIMNPHRLVYGFAYGFGFNQIVAAATLAAWILSREPKRIPMTATTVMLVAFTVWITVTTYFSLVPHRAWEQWDRAFKIQILIFLVIAILDTRPRIQALVWVMALSLGYYGARGGLATIVSGGHSQVWGPPLSMIADNNHIALALVMSLPLWGYLYTYSKHLLVRLGVLGIMALSVAAVLGTYSRGGFASLAIVLACYWWNSRHKLLLLALGAALILPALEFMPAQWHDRISTTSEYDSDSSFQQRVTSWHNHAAIANARPWLGGGFEAAYEQHIVDQYNPGNEARAAHSIYFQILGEQGYPGLALFLGVLGATWISAFSVIRGARGRPDLKWAADLARMIQVSLAGYMIGGALLSLAYWDVYYLLVAITLRLRLLVHAAVAEEAEPDGKAAQARAGAGAPWTMGSRLRPARASGGLSLTPK